MAGCKHKYYGRDGRGNITYGPICHSQPVTEDCPGEEHCVGFRSDRADRAEAELAAGERVVRVHPRPGYCTLTFGEIPDEEGRGVQHDDVRFIFGDVPDDGRSFAIRPLPDAKPDPVAVRPWRIRPNAGRPYDVCGYCQWTIKEGSDHCAECGKIVGERRELPEPGKERCDA